MASVETTLATAPAVETTSPVKERADSLEKHLQARPDAKDLKEKGILMDTNAAPSIQAAQHELKLSQASDALRRQLDHRSTRDELVGRNIMPESNAAPAIQGQQRELAKHMRADSLEKALAKRPAPGDLVKEGILTADENPLQETA